MDIVLLKVFGDGNKDPADLYRDLILTCVEEPELTKEHVEEMNATTFLKLGAEITKLHACDLENFQNIANLRKKLRNELGLYIIAKELRVDIDEVKSWPLEKLLK